jgi:hypothetical protein
MNQTGFDTREPFFPPGKLEENGYIEVEKKFVGKIPCTLLRISKKGRFALQSTHRG